MMQNSPLGKGKRYARKRTLFQKAKELHLCTGDFVSVTWHHANGTEKAVYNSCSDGDVTQQPLDDRSKPSAESEFMLYKKMLNKVLKQQIQSLIEQLSEKTGEETVVLSASIADGEFTTFGSRYGRSFIEKENEIPSKFQAFCSHSKPRGHQFKNGKRAKLTNEELTEPSLSGECTGRQVDSSKDVEPASKLFKQDDGNDRSCTTSSHLNTSNPAALSALSMIPDLTLANSNYLMKLNSTVGVPNPPPCFDKGGADVSNNTGLYGRNPDINMSVVKVEKAERLYTDDTEDTMKGYADTSDNQENAVLKTSWKTEFEEYIKLQSQAVSKVVNVNKLNCDQSDLAANEAQMSNYLSSKMSGVLAGSGYLPQVKHASIAVSAPCNTPQRSDPSTPPVYSGSLRIFKCQFCDKEFREKTNLRVHLRTHTGERPYKCLVCGKDFAHSSNLTQHERGVHKLPPKVPQYKQHFYKELSRMIDNGTGTSVTSQRGPGTRQYGTGTQAGLAAASFTAGSTGIVGSYDQSESGTMPAHDDDFLNTSLSVLVKQEVNSDSENITDEAV